MFLSFAVVVYSLVFPIIYYSIFIGDGSYNVFGVSIASRYAVSSIDDSVSSHFILPEGSGALVWGVGIEPMVDPGYSKTIYHGGLGALFLFFIFYFFVYFYSMAKCRGVNRLAESWPASNWVKIFRYSLFLMLLVILIGNIKNLYFFTRGYHELYVLIFSILLALEKCLRKRRHLAV